MLYCAPLGSCLIVGSAYHKNHRSTNLRLAVFCPLAVFKFAMNNAASRLNEELAPFFIDRGRSSSPAALGLARS